MNEIADDLAMSKPSVYYYFPDKIALVVAVVERIVLDYQEKLKLILADAKSLKEAIFFMLDLRREFFQKYFMLHLADSQDLYLAKKELKDSIQYLRRNEINLITDVFRKGISLQEISCDNAEKTAELFMDMLAGINICVLAKHEKQLVPDDKGFDEVLTKQKELSEIFLNGIKY